MKRKQLPEKVKRAFRAKKPSSLTVLCNSVLERLDAQRRGTELPPAPAVPVERVENEEQREARLLRAAIVFDEFVMRYGTKKQ